VLWLFYDDSVNILDCSFRFSYIFIRVTKSMWTAYEVFREFVFVGYI
jgi:hypothetical protein